MDQRYRLVLAILIPHGRSSKNAGVAAVVTEEEARACRHAFMTPERPMTLGRAFGPLMAWLTLFLILVFSGLTGQSGRALQPDGQMVTKADAR
jgi:hypothetical protein